MRVVSENASLMSLFRTIIKQYDNYKIDEAMVNTKFPNDFCYI